jgi:hypothetical protein
MPFAAKRAASACASALCQPASTSSSAGSQKILVVGSEAETARCGRGYGGSVGDGQQLQEVVPEHGQVVAGSERMDAGRRQGKAEGSEV